MPLNTSGAEVRLRVALEGKTDASFRQIERDLQDLDRRVNAGIAQNAKNRESWQAAGMGIKQFAGAVGMAAGIIAGAGLAIKQAMDFAEAGADMQRLEKSSADLADHYGTNMGRMLDSLREYSQGTISNRDLILSADRAMMLGVSTNAEQMGQLLQVAALRGRAMGVDTTKAFSDIVTGIGRMSPLILDNLGIIVNAKQTYKDYAEAIGKTARELTPMEKRQALLNRVLEEGNRMLEEAGGLAEDNKTAYERWEASWANFVAEVQKTAAPTGASLADAATTALAGWQEYFKFLESQKQIYSIQVDIQQSGGPKAITDENRRQAEEIYRAQQAIMGEITTGAANYEDAAVRAFNRAAEAAGEVIPPTEVIEYTTEDLLDVTSRLNDVQEKYHSSMEDIAVKRQEINEGLADGSIKAGEAKEKFKELEEAERKASEAALEASRQIVFGILSQKLAADGNYETILRIGEAWGLIDPAVAKAGENILGILDNENMSLAQQKSALDGIVIGMLNTGGAAEKVGPQIEKGMSPANQAMGEGGQKAAYYVEQMDNLRKHSGESYDYFVNLHVSGRIPAIGNTDPTCFIAGTMVWMADGGRKAIEKVKVGDRVVSYDPQENSHVLTTVVETFEHSAGEINGYLLVNDRIGVTPEHLLFVGGEWKPAGALMLGDELLRFDGEVVVVTSLRWVERQVPTYNLHIDHEVHNYFANGVLVHNTKTEGDLIGYASGGQMGAGWKMVGEEGYEIISPTGYVFTHEQSRALLASGLTPEMAYRIGGDMSADEREYYRRRPLGDLAERRARRRSSSSGGSTGGGGGGGGGGNTSDDVVATAVQTVTALATQTAAVSASVEFTGQQQTQATRDSTARLEAGNDAMLGKLDDIRRLLSRMPGAREQVALARSGAAQAV